MKQCKKSIQTMKQRVLEQHILYRKAGRAITIWGETLENINNLIVQQKLFRNIIFADCIIRIKEILH